MDRRSQCDAGGLTMGTPYYFDDIGVGGIAGVMTWIYDRASLCIRVHISGIPGWTNPTSGRAVLDDHGYLVRVD